MSLWTRRSLLKSAPAFAALAAGVATRRSVVAAPQPGEEVISQPFARVVQLAEGVWAIQSTPFAAGNLTTTCNGGIVSGTGGVLVIEGFNTLSGAAWASDVAEKLTGRRPTHVVVSHYHADHSNGLAGFQRGSEDVAIIATAKTRQLIMERYAATPTEADGSSTLAKGRKFLLPDSVIVDTSRPTELDLGGRVVTLLPRLGHTPSDLAVRIEEPRILWAGDLVFNGLFPNYVDALPAKLGESCNELLKDPETTYVPGHGALSDAAGLKPYLGLLESVEEVARKAHGEGKPAADVWQSYEVPASLGEWRKFRPDIFRFAFEAWERELKG